MAILPSVLTMKIPFHRLSHPATDQVSLSALAFFTVPPPRWWESGSLHGEVCKSPAIPLHFVCTDVLGWVTGLGRGISWSCFVRMIISAGKRGGCDHFCSRRSSLHTQPGKSLQVDKPMGIASTAYPTWSCTTSCLQQHWGCCQPVNGSDASRPH